MDWLSRIVAWLSDHEAAISAVTELPRAYRVAPSCRRPEKPSNGGKFPVFDRDRSPARHAVRNAVRAKRRDSDLPNTASSVPESVQLSFLAMLPGGECA